MRNVTHTAQHVAEICEQKNAAYGDSVAASAEALKLLYPNGLRPDQYLDAIFAARDFDKRSRLAQGDGSGEDPRLDIAGYALLALHHSENQRKATAPCASVNEDAVDPSPATPGSAARGAKPPTPPSSAGIDASKSWQTLVRLCAAISALESTRPGNAPAHTAQTPASAAAAASVAGRRRLRRFSVNVLWLCAGWLGYDFYINVPATPWVVLLAFFALLFFAASFIPPVRDDVVPRRLGPPFNCRCEMPPLVPTDPAPTPAPGKPRKINL